MFKPVNQYYSWNHKTKIYGTSKCLDTPLNIIKNAYSMKVDTSQYQRNRNYFSNLYKSMRGADISHQDILAVYGNPYIGTVTKWNELSWQRKQNILRDYPETDRIAERINEAKQALTLKLANDDYDTKQFIQDFVIVGLSVWAEKQFKLPNTLMAPVYATRMERAFAYIQPKYEKIAYKLSDKAWKLYKKAEDFFKKKINTETKPRLGTSGYKLGRFWKEQLVDSVQGLKNLGVKSKKIDDILGQIQRAKRYFRDGEIKADKYGNLYKFDRSHPDRKVHLERIVETKKGFKNDAEIDPETGEIMASLLNRITKK